MVFNLQFAWAPVESDAKSNAIIGINFEFVIVLCLYIGEFLIEELNYLQMFSSKLVSIVFD
jgi:hypothetical protein